MSESRNGWWTILAAAIGAGGVLGGAGYAVGKDASADSLEVFRERNTALKAKLDELDAEISSLKRELVEEQGRSRDSQLKLAEAVQPSPVQVAAKDYVPTITSIPPGSTKALFGGDLSITLIETEHSGSPARPRAHFTLSSPRGDSVTFEGKEVGFSDLYLGYQVQVATASSGSQVIGFVVTPLPRT